jgi:Pro-kumamolisin, activation domain/Subtilase family
MRRSRLSLALLTCLALACCGATPAGAAATGAVRVGVAPQLPAGATLSGAVSPERPLDLYVALEPGDPAGLEAFAAAVSTPGSPVYGQYLSVPDFAARFGATPAQVATVRSALLARGLQVGEPSANDLSLPVSATAAEAEAAFGTTLERIQTADGRVAYANTSAPRIAAPAAPYVAGVIGLDDLNVPERQPVEPAAAGSEAPSADAAAEAESAALPQPAATGGVLTGGPQPCLKAQETKEKYEGGYTADQIASAYGLSGFYAGSDFGQGQSIALLELEPFLPEDIALYQACYGTGTTVEAVNVEGGPGPYAKGDGGESELDIEQLIGLAPAAKVIVYQGPNTASIPIVSTFVTQNAAKVMSSSWGLCEKFTGRAEMSAFDTLLQEAAVQGQSFFVAAGDAGSTDCYNPENGDNDKSLQVDFPGTDPFATSVGGTQMEEPTTPPVQYIWNDEEEEGAGGGGISSHFPMPSYQLEANRAINVLGPLSSGATCGFSGYCRQVPDVSADASPRTGYIVRAEKKWLLIGGTSAAAPLWAAFTTLANASPACLGKSIGFANPALYAIAGGSYAGNFDDVLTSRPGGPKTTNFFSESKPYEAGPYYDMATGLGTPTGPTLGASLCALARTATPVAPVTPTSPATPMPTPAPPTPPGAPTPEPHLTGPRLSGVAKGRPRLDLRLAAREGAQLETLTITLPVGVVPARARETLARGLLVRDGTGRPLKVVASTYAQQSVRIRLASPRPAVTVTLRPPALSVTAKLLKHFDSGITRKLGLVVAARESGGQGARFPLVVKLT